MYTNHAHYEADVPAPAGSLFEYLDDPLRLTSHMSRSSWMMAGGRMIAEVDDAGGRSVGSAIRMHGSMLGIQLSLEEAVTLREPPLRKEWATTVPPRLLVIADYRMGFEITPTAPVSKVRVYIDYRLPSGWWRLVARALGPWYARWCTRRMAADAARHFRHSGGNTARLAPAGGHG